MVRRSSTVCLHNRDDASLPASSTAALNRCILYSLPFINRTFKQMTDSEKMLLMLISVVAALGLAGLYLLLKVLWRIVAELERRNRSL